MRRYDKGTTSKHDHNVVPGAQSALNVRASKERLPFATWETRLVANMAAWDDTRPTSVSDREAARARLAEARATFPVHAVLSNRIGRRR